MADRRIRKRHGEPIYLPRVSPPADVAAVEGELSVSVEYDAIWVWNRETRQVIARHGLPKGVRPGKLVGISSVGDAVFAKGSVLTVWRRVMATMEHVSMSSEIGRDTKLVLSADGSHLARHDDGDDVDVWRLADGHRHPLRLRLQCGHTDYDTPTLSSDGRTLLMSAYHTFQSGSDSTSYALIDVATGAVISDGQGREGDTVTLGKDGRKLLFNEPRPRPARKSTVGLSAQNEALGISEDERFIVMWDRVIDQQAGAVTLVPRRQQVHAVALRGGRRVAIEVDRLVIGELRGAFEESVLDNDEDLRVALSDDGAVAVAHAVKGRRLSAWSTDTGRKILEVALPRARFEDRVTAMAASADRVVLARPGQVQIYSLAGGGKSSLNLGSQIEERTGRRLGGCAVDHIALRPDGAMALCTRGHEGELSDRVYPVAILGDDTVRHVIWREHTQARAVALSADKVAVAYWDGIYVYALAPLQQLAILTGHVGCAVALRFSGDGKTLYSRGRDTAVIVWEVRPDPVFELVFPDEDGMLGIRFFDGNARYELLSLGDAKSLAHDLSAASERLAAGHPAQLRTATGEVGLIPDGDMVQLVAVHDRPAGDSLIFDRLELVDAMRACAELAGETAQVSTGPNSP